jgi:hypothetical protein
MLDSCTDKVCNWQYFDKYAFLYLIVFGGHILQIRGSAAVDVITLQRAEMIYFCIPLNIYNFE